MERYQIVSTKELRQLLRGEILPGELLGESWDTEHAPEVKAEALYTVSMEDIVSMLRRAVSMDETSAERFLDDWLFMATDTEWFAESTGLTSLSERAGERAGHFPDMEEDWLLFILDELEDAFEEEEAQALPLAEELLEAGECWLSNQGRDKKDWDIPEEILDRFICDYDEMMESGDAFKDELELFQYYVEKLVTEGDRHARHIKAYQCLKGTAAFAKDPALAEELLRELFEETREPACAYSLGCLLSADGRGEAEEAFRYFLFAAGADDVRAKCRLSSMYLKGQGIWENRKAAKRIADMVSEETRKDFCRGAYEGYFAEAALAESEYYALLAEEETNRQQKLNYVIESYGFALQSVFALKKRRLLLESDEDEETGRRAEALLNRHRELVQPQAASGIRTEYLQDIMQALQPEPVFLLQVSSEGESCRLRLRNPRRHDEERAPEFLLTVPEADYCDLAEEVVIACRGVHSLTVESEEEFFITSCDFELTEACSAVHFYQFDKEICSLEAEEFKLTFGDI